LGDIKKVSRSRFFWGCLLAFCLLPVWFAAGGEDKGSVIDLGLSARHYRAGQVPQGWDLRRSLFGAPTGEAYWVRENGLAAIKLHSQNSLVFLEKTVDIDISEFPLVTWRWKVENILPGIDETTKAGDDHPIRIFFVFAPDPAQQSWWFRLKRFLYLDRVHGHPVGGRFLEYLWSSYLPPAASFRIREIPDRFWWWRAAAKNWGNGSPIKGICTRILSAYTEKNPAA